MFLRRFTALLFFLILLYPVIFLPRDTAAQSLRVLILHSYNQGYSWTDAVMAGMDQVFARAADRVERHVEYMDTKRFPPNFSFDLLETYLIKKYQGMGFDVILLSDNNALNFAVSRRAKLFAGVPMVFCGINDFSIAMLQGEPGITGILEEIDIAGTIGLARQLFPRIRQFAVVNDHTPTGRANKNKLTRAINELGNTSLRFIFLEDHTRASLAAELAALPDKTGILVFTFHKDKEGQWLSADDFLSLIEQHAAVPVFSFWDHYMGRGVVGGKMVSGRQQGMKCAEYAMAILAGQPVTELPILAKSPNIKLLDYRQLNRFNVDPRNVPDDTQLLFRPDSLLKKYRDTLLFSGLALVFLLAVLVLVAINAAMRKKAMDTLTASEARYLDLVDATEDLVWSMDLNGRLTDINKAVYAVLGYTGQEVLHTEVCSYLDKACVQEARQQFQDAVSTQNGWTGMVLTWQHKNGEARVLESTARPQFDAQKELIGFSGIDRDISLRYQTKQILDQSEEKYRRIFENSVVGFFQSTPQGKFINVNPAFARMLGYDSPQHLLTSVSDITTQYYADPLDRENYRRILNKTGKVDGLEFRVKRRDGRQLWVANSTRAYFDDQGRVTHYEGVITEITKRKLAEEALEKRIVALTRPLDNGNAPITFEELFNLEDIQALQDKFAQAMGGVASVITDPEGAPITRPSNFSTLCRLIAETQPDGSALCSRSRSDAAMAEGPTVEPCCHSGLWRTGASIRIQGTHIATWLIGQVRDPSRTEEEIRAYARETGCDEDRFAAAFHEIPAIPLAQFEQMGQSLYTLASLLSNIAFQNLQQARLITALQQSESEQKSLQSQLLQAQKMESVGRLAGGVAHDFNNMLSIITGNAELLLNDLDPSHPFSENLTEITKAAERSSDLTRQLLAFARKQTISPRTVNLNETLEGMFKMLRRLIGEDIQLTWYPCPDLWTVCMDPSQVDQILANLCVNARDAIDGTGTISIRTDNCTFDAAFCKVNTAFQPGQFVQLTISDNGAGMDPHTLDNIFDPFFTTKKQGQGTGLGLATVYGIVTQNNGFILVDSQPGRGTTFTIHFPRYTALPGDGNDAEALPRIRGGRETLLVVEDEAAILKITARLLEQLGYRVLATTYPKEALNMCKNRQRGEIRLLLTDVIMPEMNGRDLARQILGQDPDIRCLFMSGYTEDVIADHGVLDQGLDFIAKPFARESLAAKIREILDRP